jgi:L-fuconolactonase
MTRKTNMENLTATARNKKVEITDDAPLEPELIICDSHHHLWYPAPGGYSLEDFRRDVTGGHNVLQTVFIESRKMLKPGGPVEMQPVGETEFVYNLTNKDAGQSATRYGIAAGIVGFADLTLGSAVIPVLEAHLAAGHDRFKGIRYTTTWDASPDVKSSAARGIMANSKFREGFAALARYNLSFDAWLYHPQLPELFDLARKFPDIYIVICHAGGPLGIGPYAGQRQAVFQKWKKTIADLAKLENVYIKMGGLGMDTTGFGWSQRPQPPDLIQLAESFAPYFSWCIEQFGVKRCMFESNFPVDKKAYSYTVLWNAFKRITTQFSINEKQALFYHTAAEFYRLPSV